MAGSLGSIYVDIIGRLVNVEESTKKAENAVKKIAQNLSNYQMKISDEGLAEQVDSLVKRLSTTEKAVKGISTELSSGMANIKRFAEASQRSSEFILNLDTGIKTTIASIRGFRGILDNAFSTMSRNRKNVADLAAQLQELRDVEIATRKEMAQTRGFTEDDISIKVAAALNKLQMQQVEGAKQAEAGLTKEDVAARKLTTTLIGLETRLKNIHSLFVGQTKTFDKLFMTEPMRTYENLAIPQTKKILKTLPSGERAEEEVELSAEEKETMKQLYTPQTMGEAILSPIRTAIDLLKTQMIPYIERVGFHWKELGKRGDKGDLSAEIEKTDQNLKMMSGTLGKLESLYAIVNNLMLDMSSVLTKSGGNWKTMDEASKAAIQNMIRRLAELMVPIRRSIVQTEQLTTAVKTAATVRGGKIGAAPEGLPGPTYALKGEPLTLTSKLQEEPKPSKEPFPGVGATVQTLDISFIEDMYKSVSEAEAGARVEAEQFGQANNSVRQTMNDLYVNLQKVQTELVTIGAEMGRPAKATKLDGMNARVEKYIMLLAKAEAEEKKMTGAGGTPIKMEASERKQLVTLQESLFGERQHGLKAYAAKANIIFDPKEITTGEKLREIWWQIRDASRFSVLRATSPFETLLAGTTDLLPQVGALKAEVQTVSEIADTINLAELATTLEPARQGMVKVQEAAKGLDNESIKVGENYRRLLGFIQSMKTLAGRGNEKTGSLLAGFLLQEDEERIKRVTSEVIKAKEVMMTTGQKPQYAEAARFVDPQVNKKIQSIMTMLGELDRKVQASKAGLASLGQADWREILQGKRMTTRELTTYMAGEAAPEQKAMAQLKYEMAKQMQVAKISTKGLGVFNVEALVEDAKRGGKDMTTALTQEIERGLIKTRTMLQQQGKGTQGILADIYTQPGLLKFFSKLIENGDITVKEVEKIMRGLTNAAKRGKQDMKVILNEMGYDWENLGKKQKNALREYFVGRTEAMRQAGRGLKIEQFLPSQEKNIDELQENVRGLIKFLDDSDAALERAKTGGKINLKDKTVLGGLQEYQSQLKSVRSDLQAFLDLLSKGPQAGGKSGWQMLMESGEAGGYKFIQRLLGMTSAFKSIAATGGESLKSLGVNFDITDEHLGKLVADITKGSTTMFQGLNILQQPVKELRRQLQTAAGQVVKTGQELGKGLTGLVKQARLSPDQQQMFGMDVQGMEKSAARVISLSNKIQALRLVLNKSQTVEADQWEQMRGGMVEALGDKTLASRMTGTQEKWLKDRAKGSATLKQLQEADIQTMQEYEAKLVQRLEKQASDYQIYYSRIQALQKKMAYSTASEVVKGLQYGITQKGMKVSADEQEQMNKNALAVEEYKVKLAQLEAQENLNILTEKGYQDQLNLLNQAVERAAPLTAGQVKRMMDLALATENAKVRFDALTGIVTKLSASGVKKDVLGAQFSKAAEDASLFDQQAKKVISTLASLGGGVSTSFTGVSGIIEMMSNAAKEAAIGVGLLRAALSNTNLVMAQVRGNVGVSKDLLDLLRKQLSDTGDSSLKLSGNFEKLGKNAQLNQLATLSGKLAGAVREGINPAINALRNFYAEGAKELKIATEMENIKNKSDSLKQRLEIINELQARGAVTIENLREKYDIYHQMLMRNEQLSDRQIQDMERLKVTMDALGKRATTFYELQSGLFASGAGKPSKEYINAYQELGARFDLIKSKVVGLQTGLAPLTPKAGLFGSLTTGLKSDMENVNKALLQTEQLYARLAKLKATTATYGTEKQRQRVRGANIELETMGIEPINFEDISKSSQDFERVLTSLKQRQESLIKSSLGLKEAIASEAPEMTATDRLIQQLKNSTIGLSTAEKNLIKEWEVKKISMVALETAQRRMLTLQNTLKQTTFTPKEVENINKEREAINELLAQNKAFGKFRLPVFDVSNIAEFRAAFTTTMAESGAEIDTFLTKMLDLFAIAGKDFKLRMELVKYNETVKRSLEEVSRLTELHAKGAVTVESLSAKIRHYKVILGETGQLTKEQQADYDNCTMAIQRMSVALKDAEELQKAFFTIYAQHATDKTPFERTKDVLKSFDAGMKDIIGSLTSLRIGTKDLSETENRYLGMLQATNAERKRAGVETNKLWQAEKMLANISIQMGKKGKGAGPWTEFADPKQISKLSSFLRTRFGLTLDTSDIEKAKITVTEATAIMEERIARLIEKTNRIRMEGLREMMLDVEAQRAAAEITKLTERLDEIEAVQRRVGSSTELLAEKYKILHTLWEKGAIVTKKNQAELINLAQVLTQVQVKYETYADVMKKMIVAGAKYVPKGEEYKLESARVQTLQTHIESLMAATKLLGGFGRRGFENMSEAEQQVHDGTVQNEIEMKKYEVAVRSLISVETTLEQIQKRRIAGERISLKEKKAMYEQVKKYNELYGAQGTELQVGTIGLTAGQTRTLQLGPAIKDVNNLQVKFEEAFGRIGMRWEELRNNLEKATIAAKLLEIATTSERLGTALKKAFTEIQYGITTVQTFSAVLNVMKEAERQGIQISSEYTAVMYEFEAAVKANNSVIQSSSSMYVKMAEDIGKVVATGSTLDILNVKHAALKNHVENLIASLANYSKAIKEEINVEMRNNQEMAKEEQQATKLRNAYNQVNNTLQSVIATRIRLKQEQAILTNKPIEQISDQAITGGFMDLEKPVQAQIENMRATLETAFGGPIDFSKLGLNELIVLMEKVRTSVSESVDQTIAKIKQLSEGQLQENRVRVEMEKEAVTIQNLTKELEILETAYTRGARTAANMSQQIQIMNQLQGLNRNLTTDQSVRYNEMAQKLVRMGTAYRDLAKNMEEARIKAVALELGGKAFTGMETRMAGMRTAANKMIESALSRVSEKELEPVRAGMGIGRVAAETEFQKVLIKEDAEIQKNNELLDMAIKKREQLYAKPLTGDRASITYLQNQKAALDSYITSLERAQIASAKRIQTQATPTVASIQEAFRIEQTQKMDEWNDKLIEVNARQMMVAKSAEMQAERNNLLTQSVNSGLVPWRNVVTYLEGEINLRRKLVAEMQIEAERHGKLSLTYAKSLMTQQRLRAAEDLYRRAVLAKNGELVSTSKLLDDLNDDIEHQNRTLGEAAGRWRGAQKALQSFFTDVKNLVQIQIRWYFTQQMIFRSLSTLSEGFRFYKDLEFQVHRVTSALVGSAEAGIQTKQVFSTIKHEMVRTGKSAQDLATILWELVSAGISTREAMAGVAAITDLAVASELDLQETVRISAGLYRVYGDSIKTAGSAQEKWQYITDRLSATLVRSQVDMNGLVAGLSYLVNEADAAGVQFEQTLAILSLLNNRLLMGSKAGRSASRVLTQLTSNAKELSRAFNIEIDTTKPLDLVDILEQLNVKLQENTVNGRLNVETFDKLQDIFGQVGKRAAVGLIQNIEELKKTTAELKYGTFEGLTEMMAEEKLDTVAAKIDRITNAFKLLVLEGLSPALGMFDDLIDAVKDLTEYINNLDPWVKTVLRTVITIIGWGAALKVLFKQFGKWGFFGEAGATVGLVTGFGTLFVGLGKLMKNFGTGLVGTFKTAFKVLRSDMKAITIEAGGKATAVRNVLAAMPESLSGFRKINILGNLISAESKLGKLLIAMKLVRTEATLAGAAIKIAGLSLMGWGWVAMAVMATMGSLYYLWKKNKEGFREATESFIESKNKYLEALESLGAEKQKIQELADAYQQAKPYSQEWRIIREKIRIQYPGMLSDIESEILLTGRVEKSIAAVLKRREQELELNKMKTEQEEDYQEMLKEGEKAAQRIQKLSKRGRAPADTGAPPWWAKLGSVAYAETLEPEYESQIGKKDILSHRLEQRTKMFKEFTDNYKYFVTVYEELQERGEMPKQFAEMLENLKPVSNGMEDIISLIWTLRGGLQSVDKTTGKLKKGFSDAFAGAVANLTLDDELVQKLNEDLGMLVDGKYVIVPGMEITPEQANKAIMDLQAVFDQKELKIRVQPELEFPEERRENYMGALVAMARKFTIFQPELAAVKGQPQGELLETMKLQGRIMKTHYNMLSADAKARFRETTKDFIDELDFFMEKGYFQTEEGFMKVVNALDKVMIETNQKVIKQGEMAVENMANTREKMIEAWERVSADLVRAAATAMLPFDALLAKTREAWDEFWEYASPTAKEKVSRMLPMELAAFLSGLNTALRDAKIKNQQLLQSVTGLGKSAIMANIFDDIVKNQETLADKYSDSLSGILTTEKTFSNKSYETYDKLCKAKEKRQQEMEAANLALANKGERERAALQQQRVQKPEALWDEEYYELSKAAEKRAEQAAEATAKWRAAVISHETQKKTYRIRGLEEEVTYTDAVIAAYKKAQGTKTKETLTPMLKTLPAAFEELVQDLSSQMTDFEQGDLREGILRTVNDITAALIATKTYGKKSVEVTEAATTYLKQMNWERRVSLGAEKTAAEQASKNAQEALTEFQNSRATAIENIENDRRRKAAADDRVKAEQRSGSMATKQEKAIQDAKKKTIEQMDEIEMAKDLATRQEEMRAKLENENALLAAKNNEILLSQSKNILKNISDQEAMDQNWFKATLERHKQAIDEGAPFYSKTDLKQKINEYLAIYDEFLTVKLKSNESTILALKNTKKALEQLLASPILKPEVRDQTRTALAANASEIEAVQQRVQEIGRDNFNEIEKFVGGLIETYSKNISEKIDRSKVDFTSLALFGQPAEIQALRANLMAEVNDLMGEQSYWVDWMNAQADKLAQQGVDVSEITEIITKQIQKGFRDKILALSDTIYNLFKEAFTLAGNKFKLEQGFQAAEFFNIEKPINLNMLFPTGKAGIKAAPFLEELRNELAAATPQLFEEQMNQILERRKMLKLEVGTTEDDLRLVTEQKRIADESLRTAQEQGESQDEINKKEKESNDLLLRANVLQDRLVKKRDELLGITRQVVEKMNEWEARERATARGMDAIGKGIEVGIGKYLAEALDLWGQFEQMTGEAFQALETLISDTITALLWKDQEAIDQAREQVKDIDLQLADTQRTMQEIQLGGVRPEEREEWYKVTQQWKQQNKELKKAKEEMDKLTSASYRAKKAFADFAKTMVDLLVQMIAKLVVAVALVGIIKGITGETSIMGVPIGDLLAKGGVVKGGFTPIGKSDVGMISKIFGARKYGTGGVFNQPALGIIGEGRNNEAVVPLPDNRSIPVRFLDKENQQSGTTQDVKILNVFDPQMLPRLILQYPDAVVNVVNEDIAKRGPIFRMIKQVK